MAGKATIGFIITIVILLVIIGILTYLLLKKENKSSKIKESVAAIKDKLPKPSLPSIKL